MRKYWHIAGVSWQEYFAYRLNLGLEVIGGVLFTLVTIWLWQGIAAGRDTIGGFSHAELITYLIGTSFIASYYFIAAQGDEINDEINRGFLSVILVRPLSPLLTWFVRDQARKLLTLTVGGTGLLLVAVYYRELLLPPTSLSAVVVFIVFVLLGSVLHFLLFGLFAMFAFWSEQTWGERFLLRIIGELAAGVIIPLSLLPNVLYQVVLWLPFKFFAYIPMQLYLGKLSAVTVTNELLQLVAWIIVLGSAVWITWRRGLRAYAGEGI
ncbi:MAG: ABC-2 family transporter protein [Candidatus Kerfeldbacteria bacterium]|nr:ABC-2 family transporter protein [Candidatus Kerfeldbacteria bacterium]